MKKYHFNFKKYGLRPSDYNNMLAFQKGRCAICGYIPAENEKLCIDHDHQYEEEAEHGVRGLLCNNCNIMIGHAKDNPEILIRAAKYLEEGGHSSRFYVEGGKLIEVS